MRVTLILFRCIRRAAGWRAVFHLDLLGIELGNGFGHAVQGFIEAERLGVFGPEANGIDPRDGEALKIRAGQRVASTILRMSSRSRFICWIPTPMP